ncbi:MAG TPA: hypothetical protein VG387_01340 [Rhizomicrobium sp.]|nr:hypothetical protein [Rhizomicrobium sp.]
MNAWPSRASVTTAVEPSWSVTKYVQLGVAVQAAKLDATQLRSATMWPSTFR